jgi:lipoprotein-anchoring transpeptidase ErfK/SrfK
MVAAAVALLFVGPAGPVGKPADPEAAEPEGDGRAAFGTAVSRGGARPWSDRADAGLPRAPADARPPSPAQPQPRPGLGWAAVPAPQAGADAALPARSGAGRRIVYSMSRQRVWLVRAGRQVVATYLVSGRLHEPSPGTYRVYSKSRHTRSAVSPDRMEYMVRFAHGRRAAIGFHSIPVRLSTGKPTQSVRQLGQPLSAGCIRQRAQDAAYLWRFAPIGTRVVVTH